MRIDAALKDETMWMKLSASLVVGDALGLWRAGFYPEPGLVIALVGAGLATGVWLRSTSGVGSRSVVELSTPHCRLVGESVGRDAGGQAGDLCGKPCASQDAWY